MSRSTPIYWQCPRCGLPDGWGVAPALRRVWVGASCPACDHDYRVLVTQPVVGMPQCQVVYSDDGVVYARPGAMPGLPGAERTA